MPSSKLGASVNLAIDRFVCGGCRNRRGQLLVKERVDEAVDHQQARLFMIPLASGNNGSTTCANIVMMSTTPTLPYQRGLRSVKPGPAKGKRAMRSCVTSSVYSASASTYW